MQLGESIPSPGDFVEVRTRHWLVESVTGADTLIRARLACIDDDAQGERLEVLWRNEIDASVVADSHRSVFENPGTDDPEVFSAYLRSIRWNTATAADNFFFSSDSLAVRGVNTPATGNPAIDGNQELAGYFFQDLGALQGQPRDGDGNLLPQFFYNLGPANGFFTLLPAETQQILMDHALTYGTFRGPPAQGSQIVSINGVPQDAQALSCTVCGARQAGHRRNSLLMPSVIADRMPPVNR